MEQSSEDITEGADAILCSTPFVICQPAQYADSKYYWLDIEGLSNLVHVLFAVMYLGAGRPTFCSLLQFETCGNFLDIVKSCEAYQKIGWIDIGFPANKTKQCLRHTTGPLTT